jgi:threonine dehydrogenase-like Zn-dependent dehydrogenase
MKSLIFDFNPARYAYSRIIGSLYTGAYWGKLSALTYGEYPEPELPSDEWVRVRTSYCGICASDLHAIMLRGSMDSPTTPFISFPMVPGHEVTGTIERVGSKVIGLEEGARVAINPVLSCFTRGINPPCPACELGNVSLCRNFAEGDLPPGISIGLNRQINGGFSPYIVAHGMQCLKIPEDVSLEEAALMDPFSVSLHAILQNPPRTNDTALVYGCGMLGLSSIISLRTVCPQSHIVAVAKHSFQRELASRLGAHYVLNPGDDVIQKVADITRGKVYKTYRGRPVVMGGVAVVYDCVGSADTIETSLRLTGERGRVVIIGASTPRRFEWTPVWFREIALVGSMGGGAEHFRGRRLHTYELFIELLNQGRIDVKPLITHKYPLSQYKDAFHTCVNKQAAKSVKVLFDFT